MVPHRLVYFFVFILRDHLPPVLLSCNTEFLVIPFLCCAVYPADVFAQADLPAWNVPVPFTWVTPSNPLRLLLRVTFSKKPSLSLPMLLIVLKKILSLIP